MDGAEAEPWGRVPGPAVCGPAGRRLLSQVEAAEPEPEPGEGVAAV